MSVALCVVAAVVAFVLLCVAFGAVRSRQRMFAMVQEAAEIAHDAMQAVDGWETTPRIEAAVRWMAWKAKYETIEATDAALAAQIALMIDVGGYVTATHLMALEMCKNQVRVAAGYPDQAKQVARIASRVAPGRIR